ncbi:hypothetical protein EDD18DRAFT_1369615 [Armillaria luteobubalina]|uniref:Uncharacterized protein n=1 Tax=Armillaria luteobubalina TaxID=153913 RepID=A0AA39NW94_9AGAR|nr:hypothetical protein EDD18DRAFT_1369615 [Armillaria luteobubalina]
MTNGNVSRSGSLVMAIDLIYDALVLLQQDATVLYASISGASVTGNTPSTNIYSIPWDTQIKMTFTINDLVLALDESTLFLLGPGFLSSVHVIASFSSANKGTVGLYRGIHTPGTATFLLVRSLGLLLDQQHSQSWDSSSFLSGGYKEPIYSGGATLVLPPHCVATPFTPDTAYDVVGAYPVPRKRAVQGMRLRWIQPRANRMFPPPSSHPTNTTNVGGTTSITERQWRYGSPNEKKREYYLLANQW